MVSKKGAPAGASLDTLSRQALIRDVTLAGVNRKEAALMYIGAVAIRIVDVVAYTGKAVDDTETTYLVNVAADCYYGDGKDGEERAKKAVRTLIREYPTYNGRLTTEVRESKKVLPENKAASAGRLLGQFGWTVSTLEKPSLHKDAVAKVKADAAEAAAAVKAAEHVKAAAAADAAVKAGIEAAAVAAAQAATDTVVLTAENAARAAGNEPGGTLTDPGPVTEPNVPAEVETVEAPADHSGIRAARIAEWMAGSTAIDIVANLDDATLALLRDMIAVEIEARASEPTALAAVA